MDKTCHHLLQLPASVFDSICEYLDADDLKSLSLTSNGLMSVIENIQKWAPRLHLITTDPISHHKRLTRMLPEVYPGSYLVDGPNSSDHKQHEIISLTCLPASPPTYNEAQSANWSKALRFQRKSRKGWLERKIWLCPHTGCKMDDIRHIIQQQKSPMSIYDTTALLCPFPKCSLWARHGLVVTRTSPAIYEMCSTIRIYRRPCPSLEVIRRLLLGPIVSPHLTRAIGKLCLPICAHLYIGSSEVSASLSFDEASLLHASQHHIDVNSIPRFQQALYQQSCKECRSTGTYTTWGFLARYTEDSNVFWLDVEMVLCRPLFDSDVQDEYASNHW